MLRTATVVKSLIAVTAITPLLCQAESSLQTGGGALSARAHVDFQITIPKFLFLRVGNGTGNAAGGWGTNGAIDLITFAPAAAKLGNGVAVAGTGGGGFSQLSVQAEAVVRHDMRSMNCSTSANCRCVSLVV